MFLFTESYLFCPSIHYLIHLSLRYEGCWSLSPAVKGQDAGHLEQVTSPLQTYFVTCRISYEWWEILLFRWNLAHIDPDTNDFPGLHSHWAWDVIAAHSPQRRVSVRTWRVLDALPPGTRLPMIHSAWMLIAVPRLLQCTDIGTLESSWNTTTKFLQHIST